MYLYSTSLRGLKYSASSPHQEGDQSRDGPQKRGSSTEMRTKSVDHANLNVGGKSNDTVLEVITPAV